MLKVEGGKVEVNGRTDVLLAELSGLIFALREKEVAPDELLKSAIKKGFMTKEEIHKSAMEIIGKMDKDELLDSFRAFLSGLGGNDNDI